MIMSAPAYLSLLFAFTVTQITFGQHSSRFVSGLVTCREDGSHLEGVTVKVKGSAAPTSNSGTQQDGAYYVEVTEKDSILVFSLEGYDTQEIKLSSAKEYNVQLCRRPSFYREGLLYSTCIKIIEKGFLIASADGQ